MGFSRQGYWSGLPCPPPGDLPNPGMEPVSLTINLHWQAGSLPLAPPGKPQAGRGPLKYPGLSPTFSIDLSLCDLFLQWNNLYFQLHPCPCHQCGHTQPISKVPGSKVQWPGRGCQTLLAHLPLPHFWTSVSPNTSAPADQTRDGEWIIPVCRRQSRKHGRTLLSSRRGPDSPHAPGQREDPDSNMRRQRHLDRRRHRQTKTD